MLSNSRIYNISDQDIHTYAISPTISDTFFPFFSHLLYNQQLPIFLVCSWDKLFRLVTLGFWGIFLSNLNCYWNKFKITNEQINGLIKGNRKIDHNNK